MSTGKTKAVPLRVTITRLQLQTIQGRSLTRVEFAGEFLLVTRKRLRSGSSETLMVPMRDVVAFSEGDGGKEGTAYATILKNSVTEIVGNGIADSDGSVSLVDDSGVNHRVYLNSADEATRIEVAEDVVADAPDAFDEDEGELPRKKRVAKKSAPREKGPIHLTGTGKKPVRKLDDDDF